MGEHDFVKAIMKTEESSLSHNSKFSVMEEM